MRFCKFCPTAGETNQLHCLIMQAACDLSELLECGGRKITINIRRIGLLKHWCHESLADAFFVDAALARSAEIEA